MDKVILMYGSFLINHARHPTCRFICFAPHHRTAIHKRHLLSSGKASCKCRAWVFAVKSYLKG